MDPVTSTALVAELLKSGTLGVMIVGLAAGLWFAVRAYNSSNTASRAAQYLEVRTSTYEAAALAQNEIVEMIDV